MGSTVNVAVQGHTGARGACRTRPLEAEKITEADWFLLDEPASFLAEDVATPEFCQGRRLLEVTAKRAEPLATTLCLDREAIRRILLNEVDEAYMAAVDGAPGSAERYLEAAVAASEFLAQEYPDDPRTLSLSHLVVDITVWLDWNPCTASPAVRAGVRAAAVRTEERPEPNFYATADDPRLYWTLEGPPLRCHLESPWWLPRWLRMLMAGLLWEAVAEAHVVGKVILHRCDHQARARRLISAIDQVSVQ